MRITKKHFTESVGYLPIQDDLERSNCIKGGEYVGHDFCGWCDKHDKPIFICGASCMKHRNVGAVLGNPESSAIR